MSSSDNNLTPAKRFLNTERPSHSKFTFNTPARRNSLQYARPGYPRSGLGIEEDSLEKRAPFVHGSNTFKSPAAFRQPGPRSFEVSNVVIDDVDHGSDDFQSKFIKRGDDQIDLAYGSRLRSPDEIQTDENPKPKRRKITGLSHSRSDPIIASFSSNSSDQDLSDDDFPSIRLKTSNLKNSDFVPDATPSRTPARFKIPAGQVESSHSKFSFRTPDTQSQGSTQMTNLTLPDAFSPSRRKGKREYVYNGAAETVRNWILEAASTESSTGPRHEHSISVTAVSKDKGGRFALVVTEDAKKWLLAGQKSRTNSFSSSDIAGIRVGDRISIRGVATHWPLKLGGNSSAQMYQVAADWRVQK